MENHRGNRRDFIVGLFGGVLCQRGLNRENDRSEAEQGGTDQEFLTQ